MGTLYKKTNSNNWVFSYRKDGKNVRVMGEEHGLNDLVFKNKHEKNKLKHKLEEKFEYGKYRRFGSQTPKLRVVIDDLKTEREKKVKMNTLSINTYDGEVKRLELFWDYVKDQFGNINISRLDDKILNQYTDFCRTIRGNNSTTIHNNHKVIQVLVKYSILKDYLDTDPYEKVDVPRPIKRGMDDIPDQQEYLMIKDYLDKWVDDYLKKDTKKSIGTSNSNHSLYKHINLISYIQTQLGMRVGEVLLMKWKKGRNDIGENHSRSYVYLSPKYDELTIHFKRNKRIIPIKPKLSKLLKKVKEDTGSKVYVLEGHNKTTIRKNKKYMKKGQPLTSSYCSRPLKKLLREIGIESDYSTHTLRHGFISELVRQNLSLKKIGELVGHKHITMTELYTHLNTTDMEEILSYV